jgi:Transglutaminase-like superfamily
VPYASCLTQALAAQILLAKEGYDSEICVGVGKTELGGFIAHAWVVKDGRVLLGDMPGLLERYTPLTHLHLPQK